MPQRKVPPSDSVAPTTSAQHDPAFVEHMAGRGRPLPDYVQQEFESYLKCGFLEHGWSVTD